MPASKMRNVLRARIKRESRCRGAELPASDKTQYNENGSYLQFLFFATQEDVASKAGLPEPSRQSLE